MRFFLAILLLFTTLSTVSAEPVPLTGVPTLYLGEAGPELSLGLSRAEVEKRLGVWPPEAQEEYATYGRVLTVYVRHAKVAQLSAVPSQPGSPAWALRLDGKECAKLGESEEVLANRLGKPRLVLAKPGIEVWLFSATGGGGSDVGLLFTNHYLEAVILTPAGKLQDVLFLTGYNRSGTTP